METKYKVLIGITVLGLTFTAGRFSKPAEVKIETKEVIKTVTVKEEAKEKIVTVTKIVYKDGTIKEETKTEDRQASKTEENTSKVTESNTEVKRDVGLVLSALAIVNVSDIKQREYGITVSKRVFGNLNVTGIVTSDKKVGVGLGLSF